ncbi:MAG TPA: hypothetical protein DCQ32_07250 [Cyanobacteria bacterium UBA8156]|jgi:hypothetical protein|nr:hypothetical protein [Cyanobacteria bacterium UBA8156]
MASEVDYEAILLGAAAFDLSGLPKEYLTTTRSVQSITWVQSVFQSLGMRSLLGSSLRLEPFQYCVLHGRSCSALVLRQAQGYVSFLLPRSQLVDPSLLQWARTVRFGDLKRNPAFQTI